MGRMWQPSHRWLWQISYIPQHAAFRTLAIFSRCTERATSTAVKESSHMANIFQLYSFTRTSTWRTWKASAGLPNEMIPATSRINANTGHWDYRFAPIAWALLWRIWGTWWQPWFIRHGRCKWQSPNQSNVNRIPHYAISPHHSAV